MADGGVLYRRILALSLPAVARAPGEGGSDGTAIVTAAADVVVGGPPMGEQLALVPRNKGGIPPRGNSGTIPTAVAPAAALTTVVRGARRPFPSFALLLVSSSVAVGADTRRRLPLFSAAHDTQCEE